ncbi:MAG TPA: hypothetical protein VLS27_19635, partial [Gammaproteobacteria bacterium]|nr:hypothetical protein [Gammaproteobacteria bacterium]
MSDSGDQLSHGSEATVVRAEARVVTAWTIDRTRCGTRIRDGVRSAKLAARCILVTLCHVCPEPAAQDRGEETGRVAGSNAERALGRTEKRQPVRRCCANPPAVEGVDKELLQALHVSQVRHADPIQRWWGCSYDFIRNTR